jgi:AraC-like DNA-binding protein
MLSVCNDNGERLVTTVAHTQAVEQAIQIMHSNMQEFLTLEDLAAAAYLSPYHFNRIFRRLIGIPPIEFLSALRFQMARHLLLATTLSVTNICFEVGYTSTGSFTHRFTQLTGLSPRLLRKRAHEFSLSTDPAPDMEEPPDSSMPHHIHMKNVLRGQISAPTDFQGTIYIGLFTSPIPQGRPVSCTRLCAPGPFLLRNVPDGIYYLMSAAFPMASELQTYLLPGKKQLLSSSANPLIIHNGQISGDPDLVLRPPHLTDAPLVMALPLL